MMLFLKKYIYKSKKIFLIKFLMSVFFSVFAINIVTILADDKINAFIILTLVNYVTIDLAYEYILKNGKNFYYQIANFLYDEQDKINTLHETPPYLNKIINLKILLFRDVFLSRIVTLRFLNHDSYSCETENNNLEEYFWQSQQDFIEILEKQTLMKSKTLLEKTMYDLNYSFLEESKHLINSNLDLKDRQHKFELLIKNYIAKNIDFLKSEKFSKNLSVFY